MLKESFQWVIKSIEDLVNAANEDVKNDRYYKGYMDAMRLAIDFVNYNESASK